MGRPEPAASLKEKTTMTAEIPVLLEGVSWQTYESLLNDYANRSTPRLTYDRGTLEIMSPLRRHEKTNRSLEMLVEIVTEEWSIETENVGSTTFKRADLERGFEPDTAFYISHATAVADLEEINLTGGDPPPDLVIEIDITSPLLDRMPVFAEVGVSEVWRWQSGTLTIFVLEDGAYQSAIDSRVLPALSVSAINTLLRQRETLRQRA
jgi:Uma2 family endonuclease